MRAISTGGTRRGRRGCRRRSIPSRRPGCAASSKSAISASGVCTRRGSGPAPRARTAAAVPQQCLRWPIPPPASKAAPRRRSHLAISAIRRTKRRGSPPQSGRSDSFPASARSRASTTFRTGRGCAPSPSAGKRSRSKSMDEQLIARGLERSSFKKFAFWLVPWVVLLSWGLYAAYLCLVEGLNQTNMDNRFAFGLWIFLDLTVIAFGAGAFFTGFLFYLMRREALRAVINSAVVLGLICYSGAILVLMVDVGQPLRAWFTYWHPNVHSMLTEVTFCLTCYLVVLAIEYLPILLKNRRLRKIPKFLVFEFELHKIMPVFAAIGTLLSFFHQGSLGGLYGVMRG